MVGAAARAVVRLARRLCGRRPAACAARRARLWRARARAAGVPASAVGTARSAVGRAARLCAVGVQADRHGERGAEEAGGRQSRLDVHATLHERPFERQHLCAGISETAKRRARRSHRLLQLRNYRCSRLSAPILPVGSSYVQSRCAFLTPVASRPYATRSSGAMRVSSLDSKTVAEKCE